MEKHPNPKIAYPVAVVVVLALGGAAFALTRIKFMQSSTPTMATVTSLPHSTSPDMTALHSSSTKPAESMKGQIVLATINNGDTPSLVFFDTVGKKVVGHPTQKAAVSAGSSVDENDKIQFDSTGRAFVYMGQAGGIGGNNPIYAEITDASTGKVILKENNDSSFSQWLVTKDGSTIYAALGGKRTLYAYATSDGTKSKITDLGAINGTIFFDSTQTHIYAVESRERVDSGIHYDTVLKTVDLARRTMTERIIGVGTKDNSIPDVEGLVFGPKMLKAATLLDPFNSASIGTVDLSTGTIKSLFPFGGPGQTPGVEWSPDGMKLIFAIANIGKSIPEKQGIFIYDFASGTATQTIGTTLSYNEKNSPATSGELSLVKGSFDGSSFIYTKNETAFYHEISSGKDYPLGKVDYLARVIAHRF